MSNLEDSLGAANSYRLGTSTFSSNDGDLDPNIHRQHIEPWLSAIWQSEHLSLMLGNGFTTGVAHVAGGRAPEMATVEFEDGIGDVGERVNSWARLSAERMGRGTPNIEDQLRSALQLIGGLEVIGDEEQLGTWRGQVRDILSQFTSSVLDTERSVAEEVASGSERARRVRSLLVSFMLSFASRASSRERLHVFTTNYDRMIEYTADLTGLRVIDRFVGSLSPRLSNSRLDVDIHYNPPGIRGEPRYLDGVIRLTKLHGSIDWAHDPDGVRRVDLPFGAATTYPTTQQDPYESLMIYPNAAKDVETLGYPYAELHRDYSAALCRPNSTLVTYGYGFGDQHLNRTVLDMLSIPSTHLVVISWDDCDGRLARFLDAVGRPGQISLLLGEHFGDIETVSRCYLPKPAIDAVSLRQSDLLRRRLVPPEQSEEAQIEQRD